MSSEEDSPGLRDSDHEQEDAVKDSIESGVNSPKDGVDTPAEVEGDGDLFGSDDDEDDVRQNAGPQRKLDDEELDSGDDEGRRDREADMDEEEDIDYSLQPERVIKYDASINRNNDPEVTDGDVYLLNLPPFLGVEKENFDPSAYIAPTQGHVGPNSKDARFSPFSAASSSLFWRHEPSNAARLQSSARIIRWSDGSLTLQLASSPKDQYKISATALRQIPPNPKKPLPIHAGRQAHMTRDYDPNRDANVYLAAAHPEGSLYRMISPITGSLKVLPTGEQNDSAMMRLQTSLAAAAPTDDPVSSVREVKEDPELAKKRAELAEKEKMRAQRRRENQEQKEFDKRKRVLGRGGVRSGIGLTVGGLEDDFDGMAPTRPKKKPKRIQNRRGEIYTDDEDEEGYGGRGRTREDEYDADDGFLVGSDEEPEVADDGEEEEEEAEEDDPDVDDLEIQGRETVLQERSRAGAPVERPRSPPKRERDVEDDEEAGRRNSPPARKRHTRVVEDEEDDE